MYSVEWYVLEAERKRALGKPIERENAGSEIALVVVGAAGILAAVAVLT